MQIYVTHYLASSISTNFFHYKYVHISLRYYSSNNKQRNFTPNNQYIIIITWLQQWTSVTL